MTFIEESAEAGLSTCFTRNTIFAHLTTLKCHGVKNLNRSNTRM